VRFPQLGLNPALSAAFRFKLKPNLPRFHASEVQFAVTDACFRSSFGFSMVSGTLWLAVANL
jgi:hypothetical protein